MYVWAGMQLVAMVSSENVFHNPRFNGFAT